MDAKGNYTVYMNLSRHRRLLFSLLFLILFMSACVPPEATQTNVTVTIIADQNQFAATLPSGSSVQDALNTAGIKLSSLDRVEPPSYTLLSNQMSISIIRVTEEFEIEEQVIAFNRLNVKNESLPEGQTRLVQAGKNGIRQITYRKIFENGIEQSRTVFKTETIEDAKPEIIMVGVPSPFMSVPIPGHLAYLISGSAWLMSGSTGERRPIVTTGDLDGYVFSISPDGQWLLFTRSSEKDPSIEINSLWVVSLTAENPEPISLKAKNIVHYADWVPDRPNTINYSTVEPRSTAPGWQANNNLFRITFDEKGITRQPLELLSTNSGGIYGWWGTTFSWSPDGKRLAYSRPDSVGVVDMENEVFNPLIDLVPYQTRSDWAWVPGMNWSPDSKIIYTTTHFAPPGSANPESSPYFNVSAHVLGSNLNLDMINQSGMFSYPSPSPMKNERYWLAFLQAIFPDQSDTSRYRLVLMDRDGSNRQEIFPEDGSVGLEPQEIIWSPVSTPGSFFGIAVIYQGNLWLINVETGELHKITGDGSISKIDWK